LEKENDKKNTRVAVVHGAVVAVAKTTVKETQVRLKRERERERGREGAGMGFHWYDFLL